MTVGFLILHFKAIDVTIKCVESIRMLDGGENARIMIVDNASGNGSGENLAERYRETKNVEVILAKENLGFSRGNNLGYEKLQKKYDLDFMIVTNNDIVFSQKNFLKEVEGIYEKNPFYVLGPDVWAIYKKEHQSPIASHPRTLEETEKWLMQIERWKKSLYRDVVLNSIINLVSETRIYKKYRAMMDRKYPKARLPFDKEQENVVLLGACLIFSRDFLEKNEKVFSPETFFYSEEDILFEKCRRNHWKVLYDPHIRVQHLEGAATKQAASGYYRHQKFLYKNFEEAALIYKKYLLEGPRND